MVAAANLGASVLSNVVDTIKPIITDAVVRNTTDLSTKGFMPDPDVKVYFDQLVNTCPEKVIKANFGDKYKKRLKSGYIFLVEKGPIGSWVRETYNLGDSKQISEKEWYAWLASNGNAAMRLYMSMYPTPQIPDVLREYQPNGNTAGAIISTVGAVTGSSTISHLGAAVGDAGRSNQTTGAEVYASYDPNTIDGQTLIEYMKKVGYLFNGTSFVSSTNEMSWAVAVQRYGDLALSEKNRRQSILSALNGEVINRIQLQVSNGTNVKQAIRNCMSAYNLTDDEVAAIAAELPSLEYGGASYGLNSKDFTQVGFDKRTLVGLIGIAVAALAIYFIVKKK